MKIEHIEVSGLRSHRGNPPTSINLSDKRLVAIVGHTGAGKSSLLEALTFVLFGEATYGGKAYEELSTDGRCEMTVQMVFTVGNERYQMLRTVRPDRNGIFGNKVVYLRSVDDDGNPLTHVEGVRNVDAAVTRLLGGMTREQFCQAVLLAQNRFAALLEANPSQREALLDTLLGLNALHDARSALQTTRKAAGANIMRLAERRSLLPADPAAEAASAKAKAQSMTAITGRADTGGERLTELSTQAAGTAKEAEQLETAAALRTTAGGLGGLDRLAEASARLAVLAELDERLATAEREATSALKGAQKRLDKATTALGKAEKAHGAAGRHQVVAEQLRQVGVLLDERPGLDQAVADTEAGATKLRGELDAAKQAAAVAKTAADQARTAALKANEGAQGATSALERFQQAVEAASAAAGRLDTRADEVDAAVDEMLTASAAVEEAERALAPLGEQRAKAAGSLEEARRADAAAAAAHGCHPGDDCPLCGRSLPEDWHVPEAVDLDAAGKLLADADEALGKASGTHRRASETLATVVGRLRSGLAGATSIHGELVTLATEHEVVPAPAPAPAPSPGAEPEPPGSESDVGMLAAAAAAARAWQAAVAAWRDELREGLAPLVQRKEEATEHHAKARDALEAAETSLSKADTLVNDTNTALVGATANHEGALRARTDAENRLATTLSGVDERWRKLVDPAKPASVEEALGILAKDQASVDAAVTERTGAESDVRNQGDTLQKLAGERARDVTAPLEGQRAVLVNLGELVSDLAGRLELPGAPAIDMDAGVGALLSAGVELEERARQAVEAAGARSAELRAQVAELVAPAAEVVAALTALMAEADPEGTELGEAPEVDDPLGIKTRNRVQQIVGGAKRLAAEATNAAKAAEEAVGKAKALDDRITALESWVVDLDGAIDVLKKDNFPRWARGVKIADLVDTASEHLAEMTDSRFRFDPSLLISDEVAGVVRKASTLSGGEKFEASLALALGVSEIAGRSGVRIETLFLDEGFAGLDQAHLNRALDALESEVEAGRSIVLITHIGSVADRIQDVLLIQPDGAGGSTTKWLDEEERFELGADLDLAVP